MPERRAGSLCPVAQIDAVTADVATASPNQQGEEAMQPVDGRQRDQHVATNQTQAGPFAARELDAQAPECAKE